jgi:hypothetical protein
VLSKYHQKVPTCRDAGRKAAGLKDGKKDSRVAWNGAVWLFFEYRKEIRNCFK